MIANYVPTKDYSILHIKLTYIRLVSQMCNNGNIKRKQHSVRCVPFNKEIEITRAKAEVSNYLAERKAS